MRSTWCEQLQKSMKCDSKWKVSIWIKSSFASDMNCFLKPSFKSNEKSFDLKLYIDIVSLFSINSNVVLKSMLNDIALKHKYPSNAIFHFEGFNSYDQKDEVIKLVK